MSEEHKMNIEQKKRIRKKVKDLKPFLPRGTVKIVADEIGKSEDYVYDVKNGRRWDLDILEALLRIAEKNKKRANSAEKKLDSFK